MTHAFFVAFMSLTGMNIKKLHSMRSTEPGTRYHPQQQCATINGKLEFEDHTCFLAGELSQALFYFYE